MHTLSLYNFHKTVSCNTSHYTFADQFYSCLIHYTAPSGAPVNIIAISLTSTSVQLSWNPPPADQQNGIITNYYINMTEVETGVAVQLTVTGPTMLLIDTLHPYYVYNFFISAATVVGQGPYSTVFSIQAPEDGKSFKEASCLAAYCEVVYVFPMQLHPLLP